MAKASKAALFFSKFIAQFKWVMIIFGVLYFTSKAADEFDRTEKDSDIIHSIIAPVAPAADIMVELISKSRIFRN
jgi:hypothetical protein